MKIVLNQQTKLSNMGQNQKPLLKNGQNGKKFHTKQLRNHQTPLKKVKLVSLQKVKLVIVLLKLQQQRLTDKPLPTVK